jgi:hypothetical protein
MLIGSSLVSLRKLQGASCAGRWAAGVHMSARRKFLFARIAEVHKGGDSECDNFGTISRLTD